MTFEYLHFVCPQHELQALLTEAGLARWRLHTCDPVVTIGSEGSGLLNAFVVMDRMIEEIEEADEPGGASEGLKMTG